ncbi:MAG: phosphoglycolate phosphatase [archaeon]|nr:phosphoglycolate phosphatase [archaeon]
MDIKGFAIDVDGTITEDGGVISLDAAYALRWLEKMGYKVILVSGRSAWEALALSIYLGTTKVVVGENGGVVATSPLDMTLLADISHSLMAYDYLSNRIPNVKKKLVFPRFTEVVLERTFDLNEGRRVLDESGIPVTINDSKYGYHLTHKSVNKAVGLKVAVKHLGIDTGQIVAIGDSEIDIPMFMVCGYSVALGNAPISLKEKANFFVNASMGNGLVEAVQHVTEKFMKLRLDRGDKN